MTDRRVVVTGMGVVTPVGIGVPAFLDHLKRGVCGTDTITHFNTSRFPVKRACEVRNFKPRDHGTHLLDPFIQYAVGAADQAIRDAGVDLECVDPYSVAMAVSSSKGGMHTLDRFAQRLMETPSAILGARVYSSSVPNFAAQWIARRWKLKGPAKCYVAACATGTVAVIEGARMVADGTADYCIAGASDASVVPLMLAAYRQMKVLSEHDILPFDRRRSGFIVGEGAGILFLESYDSARARGARIYGEIAGWAYGSDPQDGVRFEESEHALSRTVRRTLERARVNGGEIDYVNLHGTGTPSGDIYETNEMKHAFGLQAKKIPMSSTKSMTGHMLGASGAVEIVACLGAMQDGFLPPTAGLTEPDPACDLDYIPCQAREGRVNTALTVSMGFGGHLAGMLLKKV